jgi:hypothetical protein
MGLVPTNGDEKHVGGRPCRQPDSCALPDGRRQPAPHWVFSAERLGMPLAQALQNPAHLVGV